MEKLNEYKLVWKCRNCVQVFETRLEVNRGSVEKDLDYIHQLIADGGMYKMHNCDSKNNRLFGEGELIEVNML